MAESDDDTRDTRSKKSKTTFLRARYSIIKTPERKKTAKMRRNH